jgi:hypothetical protein
VSSAPLLVLTGVLGSQELARKALSALIAAGYACVPIEPTRAMLEAAWAAAQAENAAEVWDEMIEAATSMINHDNNGNSGAISGALPRFRYSR